MNRYTFYKTKIKNPESRIGQRTWKYQKTRDDLVKAITEHTTYEEKMVAYMDYIIEKTFSLEPLTKRDLRRREDAVENLRRKKDVDKVMKKIKDKLRVYAERINYDVETKLKTPNPQDLKAYIAWRELLDYVAEKHHAPSEGIPALGPHVSFFAHKIWIDLDDSTIN